MLLADKQKRIILQVINVFETSDPNGGYSVVAITKDGPGKIDQISYGPIQFTEFSSLPTLLKMYVRSDGSIYGSNIDRYLDKFGNIPSILAHDPVFLQLLKDAGTDPVMQECQRKLTERWYFGPAKVWAESNGFEQALSMLVIFDSYVNSGSIRKDIRATFPAVPPSSGGSETQWTAQYVGARAGWLVAHGFSGNLYRMDCFKREIAKGNWDLNMLPIITQGIGINGT